MQQGQEGGLQAAPPGTPSCAGWGPAAACGAARTRGSPSAEWRRLRGRMHGVPAPLGSSGGMVPALVSGHREAKGLCGEFGDHCVPKNLPKNLHLPIVAASPGSFAPSPTVSGSRQAWLCREWEVGTPQQCVEGHRCFPAWFHPSPPQTSTSAGCQTSASTSAGTARAATAACARPATTCCPTGRAARVSEAFLPRGLQPPNLQPPGCEEPRAFLLPRYSPLLLLQTWMSAGRARCGAPLASSASTRAEEPAARTPPAPTATGEAPALGEPSCGVVGGPYSAAPAGAVFWAPLAAP